jgi:hypothetical protein
MDSLKETIHEKLGITAVREKLQGLVEDRLQRLCKPLSDLCDVDGVQVQAIAVVVTSVLKTLACLHCRCERENALTSSYRLPTISTSFEAILQMSLRSWYAKV